MAQHDERASPKSKELEKLERLHSAQIDKAIGQMAETVEGRRFLWWLLQVGKVGTQPFTTNALTMSFNCGELNVGNTILGRITSVSTAVYVRMQQENENEYRVFDASYDASGNPINPGDDSSDTSGAE
jgi:hypothetical protein